jgi:hypothetical protein
MVCRLSLPGVGKPPHRGGSGSRGPHHDVLVTLGVSRVQFALLGCPIGEHWNLFLDYDPVVVMGRIDYV